MLESDRHPSLVDRIQVDISLLLYSEQWYHVTLWQFSDVHAPAHVHISGDDGTTRVDLNGNPIQRDRPMTVGERKAFWNLIDKIIEELKLYFPNGG